MALQNTSGQKAEGVGTFKGYMMPPGMIDVDPAFNPRDMRHPETIAHVAAIADSMRARGFDLDRPLLGRSVGEKFVVTDGHCRFAAIRALLAEGVEIKAVPVRTEPSGTSAADRLALTLRDPGKPLSPVESADAIKRLLAFGWTEEQVADKLGKRRDWVRSCLDLAGAPEEIRTAVRTGEIAPTEAVRIVRDAPDPVATLEGARDKARERGSDKVRHRDVEAVTAPKRVTSTQEAITVFLSRWDAPRRNDEALTQAIDRLRELVPSD